MTCLLVKDHGCAEDELLDITKFVSEPPGELIKITDDYAFVPAQLPPSWRFPERLWPLLAEARQEVGTLNGIGRTLPNPAILLRPLEDREAITSSRLEGTYVTPRELLLFEMESTVAPSEDRRNDWREVANYRKALHVGATSDLPISLRLIRQMHEVLLSGVRGRDRAPGQFRRVQVAIGSTRRFVPPPPEQVLKCLDPLEKYMHAGRDTYDSLVDCFLIHYQFETIHPFVDGNGRVGRLLLAIMLQQRFGRSKPWLYMSDYFERYREEYVRHLFNISARGDWESWIEFCLQGTVTQARDTITRCDRLLKVKDEYASRLASVGGSLRLSQIVEGLFQSPYVRVADLPQCLHVTYPTAKADVDRLVQAGILSELPNVSPKTFYAKEVFAVAYEDIEGS
jgi:Fic family protein